MGWVARLRLIMTESLLLALLGASVAFGAVSLFKLIASHAVPCGPRGTARTLALLVGAGLLIRTPAWRAERVGSLEVLRNE